MARGIYNQFWDFCFSVFFLFSGVKRPRIQNLVLCIILEIYCEVKESKQVSRANPANPFFSRICAGSTLCRRMSFIDDSRIGVLHAVATEEDGRGPNGSTGASTSQSLRKTKYGHSHIHDFFLVQILLLKTYISITYLMFERGNANERN